MSVLTQLFQDFAARLCSTEFLSDARHPDHPTAFSRRRKLPLATLVSIPLTGMRMSVQAELDTFFAHLRQQAQLVHEVSEQAFAQARAKLSLTSIPLLNGWLIARAEHDGFVPRWRDLRLVAADASTVRAGHVKRAALADQFLFGRFLPGPTLCSPPPCMASPSVAIASSSLSISTGFRRGCGGTICATITPMRSARPGECWASAFRSCFSQATSRRT